MKTRRLFLAVSVPEAVRREMIRWTETWRAKDDGWRWVQPAGIHLTLRFYGETVETLLPELGERISTLAKDHQEFQMLAVGWGVFPNPSRPRVIWAGLSGATDVASSLAARAEADARDLGFQNEERPFHPHLTLARAAREGRPRLPGDPDPAAPEFGSIPARQLILFESQLGSGGARYSALGRWKIGSGEPLDA